PVTAPASPAPTQATRSARASRPAPTLVPTIATSAEPTPNTRGIWMYSSRAPMPYPASACMPKGPTSPVRSTTVRLVNTVFSEPGRARGGDPPREGGARRKVGEPRPHHPGAGEEDGGQDEHASADRGHARDRGAGHAEARQRAPAEDERGGQQEIRDARPRH